MHTFPGPHSLPAALFQLWAWEEFPKERPRHGASTAFCSTARCGESSSEGMNCSLLNHQSLSFRASTAITCQQSPCAGRGRCGPSTLKQLLSRVSVRVPKAFCIKSIFLKTVQTEGTFWETQGRKKSHQWRAWCIWREGCMSSTFFFRGGSSFEPTVLFCY